MFTKDDAPAITAASEATTLTERPDWGQVNREILASKLRKAYFERTPLYPDRGPATTADEQWLNVADEAISEILGGTK